MTFHPNRLWTVFSVVPITLLGCSSSSAPGAASCSTPGGPAPGPADSHCASAGPDGGALVQKVDLACNATPPADDGGGGGGDAGPPPCPYGSTMFGSEGDDDDCKYHVAWSSTPICEVPGSVTFTVKATRRSDGTPLAGAGTSAEVITTTPGDPSAASYCDDMSTHLSPSVGKLVEGPPGTYVGPIAFDKSGAWTVRFHFFETCTDAPDAPHGHAAFHVNVP